MLFRSAVLANSLGVDLSSLAQLTGERVVGTTTLRATGMITQQQGGIFVRIPRVTELFPTPMPNLFSIKDGILHYVGQEEEEEVEPEGEHPEEPDLEAEIPEEEAYVPPQYTTYQDLYSWGDAMFPGNFQPPPQ